MMTDLHHLLAIYVHAHQTGNSVPPHIDAEARAALADEPPEPIPPAALPEGYIDPEHSGDDRALLQTFYSACQADGGTADEVTLHGLRAAELLQRLSPPQPVPVSVRLPGPEDCDAEGRCWWFAPETEVDFGGWTFGTTEICANSQWVDWENTHWLPAHALPLPEVGE